MSLVLWLPLTKDLRNQGLSDVTVTNNGATYSSTGGKLGGCYNFTNQNIAVSSANFKNNFINQATLSAWVKVSTSHSAYAQALVFGTQGTSWNNILFGIDINGSGTPIANASTGSAYTNLSFSTAIKDGMWHHIVYTYNNGTMKVYLDGVQKNTTTTSNIPAWTNTTNLYIGGNSGGEKFQHGDSMNDVRLYNHCLSPKEVKQLSQGLVLHYKLSDTFVEPTTNLITTEDCLSSTCYNASISKYSYGSATDMYKTVTIFDGRKGTKVYMGTSGNNCYPYVYVNNMSTSNGTNAPAYKTLSFDYYTTISTSICPYKLGSGTGTATYIVRANGEIKTGTGTNSVEIPITPNAWNHVEVTFHGTTDANAEWGYIQNRPAHVSDVNNFWFFANMQLETKDHATGYAGIGGTRDGTDLIYDCSGFGYNGTKYGNLSWSNDTARYMGSYYFEDYTRHIECLIDNNWIPDAITMSCWIKGTNKSARGGYHNPLNMHSTNYEISITGSSGKARMGFVVGGTRYVSDVGSDLLDGKWHMLTITYNGSTICRYIDGQLVHSENRTGALTTLGTLGIGTLAGNTTYGNTQLYESDVRIYSTALSADDILTLYNTAATIDNQGNLFAYEVVEG